MTDQDTEATGPFIVQTSEDDGFHYVVNKITGERARGYPLKKTANRAARNLNEACAPAAPLEPQAAPAPYFPPSSDEAPSRDFRDKEEPEGEAEDAPEGMDETEDEEGAEVEPTGDPAPAEARPFQLVAPAVIVTREDWLIAATVAIRPILAAMGEAQIPAVRVTCGWPHKGGAGGKARAMGQCWNPEASDDGHAEIFISPMEDDPRTVFAVLVHELIHACLPKGTGHKAPFVKVARAVGFAKPFTQFNPTDQLWQWVDPILASLGDYPHAKLNPRGSEGEKKPQKNRQILCECFEDHEGQPCGYKARLSRKAIKEVGTPICPRHNLPMVCEALEGDDDGDAPEGEE